MCIVNEASLKALKMFYQIEEGINRLHSELNKLMQHLDIPSLRGGIIDISPYFTMNNIGLCGTSIQREECFITFPISLRNETKKVIISLVPEDSAEFKNKLASLSDCTSRYIQNNLGKMIINYPSL